MAREGLMDDCGYNFDVDEDSYNSGFKDGFLTAVDEFAEKIIRYVDCGHLCSPTEIRWSDLSVVEMVKRLAEQLKEE